MIYRALFLICLLAMLSSGCDYNGPPQQSDENANTSTLLESMGGTPAPGFARAFEPRRFEFPIDHGPHPEFATEWWYFTGNLVGEEGRRFGYQLTLFRVGLSDARPELDSSWRTTQMYMGHLAISDVSQRRHYQAERFSRAAAGLAGAVADPLRVWLGPWSITGEPGSTWPISLDASTDTFALKLALESGSKPVVLQGDRGLSQKGAAPGNASFYYSFTRLPTQGQIVIGDERLRVQGTSWFDREWSSSALADDQAGWDWFALQLDDGRDLMFYRMRGQDGEAQRFSKGVLVETDGRYKALSIEDVDLKPTRFWQSPKGISYPVAWQLAVPDVGIDIAVQAAFDAQAMDTTVAYWEGAVDVTGTHSGVGYLELSGYASEQD